MCVLLFTYTRSNGAVSPDRERERQRPTTVLTTQISEDRQESNANENKAQK